MKIDYLTDLDILINYYIEVGNSISGKKTNGQEGIKYAESIAKKTFNHICTSYSISKGLKIDLKDGSHIKFIDYSSIAVLIRSALESYLTFNHIFIAPKTENEKLYRFHCWDLAGYIERQDFQALSDESKKRKKQEQILIKKKLEIIKKFEYYKLLSIKQKKQIDNGNWKFNVGWIDLAENAGFEKGYFRDIYSYLCSYAHTGRLSALQIMQSKEQNEQKDFGSTFLSYSLVILSKYLFDYVKLIPELKPAYEKDKQGKWTVELWKNIGERLEKNNNS